MPKSNFKAVNRQFGAFLSAELKHHCITVEAWRPGGFAIRRKKRFDLLKSQGFVIPFAITRIAKCRFCGNLLITCRFLVIFLVVSRKKRNFAIRY